MSSSRFLPIRHIMYSPTFTPGRIKRSLLSTQFDPDSSLTSFLFHRERLFKRLSDLLQALPLCHKTLQDTLGCESLRGKKASRCIYCGCTCRTQDKTKVLDLRGIPLPSNCIGCRKEVTDSEWCASCRNTEDLSVYLRVEITTGFARLPSLTPRRVKFRSHSPDPMLDPIPTKQTRPAPFQVTVASGACQTQFQGPGPHLCRLILQGQDTSPRSSLLDTPLPGNTEAEIDTDETQSLVRELVDVVEQSKRHFLQPGTADRWLDRLLKSVSGVKRLLLRLYPDYAFVLDLVLSGMTLICESVAASHYDVLNSVEVHSSMERLAQIRSLTEANSRLQSELVSVRLAASSEIAALRHTVHTYEQRLQTLFRALRPDRAL